MSSALLPAPPASDEINAQCIARRRLHAASPLRAAFTLVELLVVMGIMVVLISLSAPAINAMKRSSDVTTMAYEVMDAMEQARAYALANNTYAFLGIQEVDSAQDISVTPQKSGVGRVAIAVVATKDGTLGCSDPNNISTLWSKEYATHKGSIFTVVRKLQVFDSMHLADTLGSPPLTGPMARLSLTSDRRVGSPNPTFKNSYTAFSWPLGSNLNQGQFNFVKVFTYTPQGAVYVYSKDQPTMIPQFEFGFQQSKGNIAPPAPTNPAAGNQVAIMLNAVSGAARLFRP